MTEIYTIGTITEDFMDPTPEITRLQNEIDAAELKRLEELHGIADKLAEPTMREVLIELTQLRNRVRELDVASQWHERALQWVAVGGAAILVIIAVSVFR